MRPASSLSEWTVIVVCALVPVQRVEIGRAEPLPRASEFLRRVGRSHNDWRYLLVEQPRKPLSVIHPAALREVASLVVEILANETFTDHGMDCVRRRLSDRIRLSGINKALQERTLERDENGLPQEVIDPLREWLREALNVVARRRSTGSTPSRGDRFRSKDRGNRWRTNPATVLDGRRVPPSDWAAANGYGVASLHGTMGILSGVKEAWRWPNRTSASS